MILTDSRAQKILSGIAKVSKVDAVEVKWMDSSYQVASGMVALDNGF